LFASHSDNNHQESTCTEINALQNQRITESQNHRMVGVGRDLCGLSSFNVSTAKQSKRVSGISLHSCENSCLHFVAE